MRVFYTLRVASNRKQLKAKRSKIRFVFIEFARMSEVFQKLALQLSATMADVLLFLPAAISVPIFLYSIHQALHIDRPDRAILRWGGAQSKMTPDPEFGPIQKLVQNEVLVDPSDDGKSQCVDSINTQFKFHHYFFILVNAICSNVIILHITCINRRIML